MQFCFEKGLRKINADPDWIESIVTAGLRSALLAAEEESPQISIESRFIQAGAGLQPPRLSSGKYQVLSFVVPRAFRSEEINRAFMPIIEHDMKCWAVGVELAMARRTAQEHGGESWAEDTEEGSSALRFAFPDPDPPK